MSLRRPGPFGMVADMASSAISAGTDAPAAVAVRHGLTRDDVMTAHEVAELLALPVSTVYHLARQGQLPASRPGRTWRFLRPRIEELLSA